MNPSLWFRDQVGRLSGYLRDELDQLVANIQTGWNAEHDAEGHHTDVTGTSVTLTGTLTASCCSLSGRQTIDVTVAGTQVNPTARVGFIRVTMSAGPVRIDGLVATLYVVGDEVILANASDDNGATGDDLTWRLQSTGGTANWRFRGNPGLPNTDVVLSCGRLIVVILDRNSSGTQTYWRVSHF